MTIYHYKLMKNPTPEFAWKAYKVTAPYLVIIFIAIALDSLWYINFKKNLENSYFLLLKEEYLLFILFTISILFLSLVIQLT